MCQETLPHHLICDYYPNEEERVLSFCLFFFCAVVSLSTTPGKGISDVPASKAERDNSQSIIIALTALAVIILAILILIWFFLGRPPWSKGNHNRCWVIWNLPLVGNYGVSRFIYLANPKRGAPHFIVII